MIHTLPYQSEELLKDNYFKLRKLMNPMTDTINLTVAHSHLNDLSKEEIYKKALKLEGRYRTENNSWSQPVARVRVINQL